MTANTGSIEQLTSDCYSATTVQRMMITSRMLMEVDPKTQRLLQDLLYLLERGDIMVYKDPLTGELKYRTKELN